MWRLLKHRHGIETPEFANSRNVSGDRDDKLASKKECTPDFQSCSIETWVCNLQKGYSSELNRTRLRGETDEAMNGEET